MTLTLLPVGPGLGQSFCCQLKESQESHSASRDRDPSDNSHMLHWASLVPPTIPVLDWAGGPSSSSAEHGTPSPCRAVERGWQVLTGVLPAQRVWGL